MIRRTLLILLALSYFQTVSWGADTAPAFSQNDFARLIVNRFSWDAGLPKEPADRDYLLILGGKRTFRYEAETAYNELTDRVSVREFPLFGAFTGKGWIMGVSDATSATFTILLPIAGEYELKSVIKGNGFIWKIEDKEYRADSLSGNFKETDIARVKLPAGIVTVNLTIPPEGAIDSFSLTAPAVTSIQPLAGWRFKEVLTAARMAEVAVALTNRYTELPDSAPDAFPPPIVAAEKMTPSTSAAPTKISYLGPFYSAEWVRADYRGATLQIPVTVADTGYYRLIANVMGENISGKVNEAPFRISAKPYLTKVDLGLYRLESGGNTLTINLPPTGGIDIIEFIKKRATPDDFLRLAGVRGPPERLIGADEADLLLKSILSTSSVRK